MSYNPSIFDDKISVLAQVETLKQVVKDHEEEIDGKFVITGNEIAAVESHVNEVETQLGFMSSDLVSAIDLANEASRKADEALKASEETGDEYEMVETGTYLHILSVYCYDEYYMPNRGTGVVSIVSTKKDPITFTAEDGDSSARLELAQMLSNTPEKTFYFFTSAGEKCSISSYEGNELYFNNSDTGESIDSGKVGVSDTVFPQYKKQLVIPTPDFSKTFDLQVNAASWYISNGEVNTDGIGSEGSYETVFVKAFGGDQEVSVYAGDSSATLQVPTNTRLIEFWTQSSGGEAKAWPGAGLPGYRCDIDGGYEPVIYKIPKDTTSITFYTEASYSDELERIWPLA